MNLCLETSDLTEGIRHQLDAMRKQLAENRCVDFDQQVGRLEGHLQLRYEMTVYSSRQTSDFQEVKELWSDLLAFSTFVKDQVHALVDEYGSACPHNLSLVDQLQEAILSRCVMLGLNAKH